MKTIAFTNKARKQLKALDAQIEQRIREKIAAYAKGESADVEAMRGQDGARMRVGDWRVIFQETADQIEVQAVGHRREIYN